MKKLIVSDNFVIQTSKGKRSVYFLNLKENNLPSLRKQINEELMGKEVEIFDVKCKVIGIEMFATPDTYEHKDIGVMIEPI